MTGYSYYDDIPDYTRVMVQLLLKNNDKIDDAVSYIESNSQNFFMRDKGYRPIKTLSGPGEDFYLIRGHVKTANIKDMESLSYVFKLYSDDKIGFPSP